MISEIVRKWRTSKNYDGNREHDDPLEFHKVAQRVYQCRAKQKPNGEHIQDGPYLIDFFFWQEYPLVNVYITMEHHMVFMAKSW